jgi:hypothetical protein
MARTTPTDAPESAPEAAPVTLESVNPEAARLIDDFVQAHLPPEAWQQRDMFRDRESLKTTLATLFTK